MTDRLASWRLAHGEQAQILQWLAEDWSYQYIANLVKETFSKEISRQTIFDYSKRYKTEIDELRKKINSDVLNIPISNKEVRQQRRERIFNMYMVKGELEKAREVLDEAKEEMEPKQSGVHVGVRVDNAPINGTGYRPDSLRRIVEAIERRTAGNPA